MFNNLSAALQETSITYPILDSSLPFAEYIARCRDIIMTQRLDLEKKNPNPELIIEANSPFEFRPAHPHKIKYGALLIHGLLDCPFSLRDIGLRLQSQGILSRAILLPGHGTRPSDLLHVSYHDWLQAVRYGVESMRQEVDYLYLIGYSTGAALSVYQAMQDTSIAGMILLSPAIRIKTPVHIVVGWHYLVKWITKNNEPWIYNKEEIDYTKYKSIAFNPVNQVNKLTQVLYELGQHRHLNTPMLMIVSREDETISSHRALNFFSGFATPDSQLLLYTSLEHRYPDPRILTRLSRYPDLHINHLSHMSIPFAPTNAHYGQQGDYPRASRPADHICYGAYNVIEENTYRMLRGMKAVKFLRQELTYNPDFDFMAEKITAFILGA